MLTCQSRLQRRFSLAQHYTDSITYGILKALRYHELAS